MVNCIALHKWKGSIPKPDSPYDFVSLPDDGQTFRNPVKEGLPTIQSEPGVTLVRCALYLTFVDRAY
jgi:hypothetical protein